MLVLDMSFKVSKPKRVSQFNFKDPVGQMNFFKITERNNKLSNIFSTHGAFEDQVSHFKKSMNSIYHQIFPKIREKNANSRRMRLVF